MRHNSFFRNIASNIIWFFLALGVGLLFTLPGPHADEAPLVSLKFGSVAGKVTDEDFAPIVDAKVRVIRADQVVLTGKTDEGGDYSIDDVPPGTQELLIESPGFKSLGPQSIKIRQGDTTWVNPTLTAISK